MNQADNKKSNKIIRLVEYLTALARINAKIVRTLDDYRKVLCIHDIPHEPKYCFTQAWGQEEDQNTSVWTENKKFPETELSNISTQMYGLGKMGNAQKYERDPRIA